MPDSFDETFPDGFDQCVARLGQEPSVENPEDLCEWLQEHGFEEIAEASEDVREVLLNLSVEYVSVVDEPAQDSEWLLAKSASADVDEFNPANDDPLNRGEFVLKQVDDEEDEGEDEDSEPERKVWAAVLVPGEADRQGEMVPEPEIESAAHGYLKNYRKVDSDHNLLDGSGVPIESYIVRNGPETFDLPTGETREYPEGTWIMGVELSESAWKRVEDGELTGFSIYGGAASLDPDALMSEEVAQAIKSYRNGRAVRKFLESEESLRDLLEEVDLFVADTTPDDSDVPLVEFLEWVEDEADAGLLDGNVGDEDVTEPVEDLLSGESSPRSTPGDEGEENGTDEDVEQAENQPLLESIDMDENELTNLLGEIRDTTDSIAKSVEDLDERVTDLEENGVSKSGDDEEDEEVVRKSDKTPTDETETSGGTRFDMTTRGVLGGDD